MMAKSSTKAKPNEPTKVTITYDLFDLPTAQHKAGLAGLLLQIESMRSRKKAAPTYRWDAEQPNSKVHVDFTEATMVDLFDDLYDAALVEGPPREKPFTKGKGDAKREVPPLRRAPMTKTDKQGNEKTFEGFVYLELTPSLATLRHYLPERGEWVRLWRDLLWQIVREGKKKAPYIKRAEKKQLPAEGVIAEEDQASDADEADTRDGGTGDGSAWGDLLKHFAATKVGTFATGKLSGALLLGAMEKNAEIIPLFGQVEHNLLLHFWPLTVMVFVPRFVDSDGESHIGRRSKKDSAPHFAIALPEVFDLRGFLQDYPRLLQGLGTDVAVFRPKESLIDLPAESGFAFIEHLARLVPQHAMSGEIRWTISAVDCFHVTKEGNNVKFLSTGRVEPRPHLAEDYRSVVGRPGQEPPYSNPLFRRGLMLALLEDQPWFQPFGELFAEWPHKFFVRSDDPPKLSWFWTDARKKFQEIIQAMPTEPSQLSSDPNDKLAELIYRLVRTYVSVKAKDKSGINPDDHKEGGRVVWDKVPQRYKDDRRQIAESLFMEYRSRRDQAFVNHFVARLGAVKQFISEEDYLAVSQALMNRGEDVKTMTLLALSANS